MLCKIFRMDISRMTIAEIESLLRLLAEMQRQELEQIIQKQRNTT